MRRLWTVWDMAEEMITVEEAGRLLGVSRSTVWRLIQRGELPSVRRGGRRLVQARAVRNRTRRRQVEGIAPFSHDYPMFRLVGWPRWRQDAWRSPQTRHP